MKPNSGINRTMSMAGGWTNFNASRCNVKTVGGSYPVEELPQKGIPLSWKKQQREEQLYLLAPMIAYFLVIILLSVAILI